VLRFPSIIAAAVAAAVTVSCTAPASSGDVALPADSRQAGSGSGDMTAQTLTVGYAPAAHPAVKYQPDVVVVGGGPAAVRWASSDGLTWAIDRKAPGVDKLRVDSVLLATSRAAGRVIEMHDDGDVRVVSLAPITLTDVVRDGELKLDQPVALSSMAYQHIPDAPGALSVPDDDGTESEPGTSPSAATSDVTTGHVLAVPAIRLVAAGLPQTTTVKQLPSAFESCNGVDVGKWTINPCVQPPDKISVGVEYKVAESLVFGASAIIRTQAPRTSAHVVIANGQVTSADARLDGLKGIDVTIGAGAANGAQDNAKVKIEVPIEVEEPIPPSPATGGLPLNLVFEFKLLIETAISGNNSTVGTSGSYDLSGPIGVQGGNIVRPTVTVKHNFLDSIGGVTLGPSGIVFGMKFKLHFGLGMPGLVAGPYVTFTFSIGFTKGSMLGSPLATCKNVTVGFWIGAGAGLTIDLEKFSSFLPDVLKKIKIENEKSWNVYTLEQTVPDVPLCKSGI
jgi:hypothetical protein